MRNRAECLLKLVVVATVANFVVRSFHNGNGILYYVVLGGACMSVQNMGVSVNRGLNCTSLYGYAFGTLHFCIAIQGVWCKIFYCIRRWMDILKVLNFHSK